VQRTRLKKSTKQAMSVATGAMITATLPRLPPDTSGPIAARLHRMPDRASRCPWMARCCQLRLKLVRALSGGSQLPRPAVIRGMTGPGALQSELRGSDAMIPYDPAIYGWRLEDRWSSLLQHGHCWVAAVYVFD